MPYDAKKPTAQPPNLYAAISSTQRVFLELRDKIIQGDIAPGERLKVDALKKRLNAGATPIREALSLLTSDQLVERLDQRGFRAAPASDKNFQEILTLRCHLESIALSDSIRLGDKAWEEQLVLCHHRLTQFDANIGNFTINDARRSDARDGNTQNTGAQNTGTQNTGAQNTEARYIRREREQLHKDFHIMLLQACESPVLLKFCDQLYDLNIRYRYLAGESVQYASRDVAAEHTIILNATTRRKAKTAVDALLSHYRQTGVFLADQLDSTGASVKSN